MTRVRDTTKGETSHDQREFGNERGESDPTEITTEIKESGGKTKRHNYRDP